MPEEPNDAMEDPTDAMEEDAEVAEESPVDETTDIEDAEGDMDENTAAPENPIVDLIPGDFVTEIGREDGGDATAEISMEDVEEEGTSALRGNVVAAVQTATSSAAGVKVMASIVIAGASAVVFGMM